MNTTLSRLLRVRGVLDQYRSDPYLRGRGLQVAGAALMADALVGLENPLDSRTKRAGILGTLLMVGIGLAFVLLVPLAVRQNAPYPDGVTTTGTIGSVQRGTGDGSNRCSGTVTYEVSGRTYEVRTPSSSSGLCSKQGAPVEVSYRPQSPAAGRPQLSGDGTTLRIALGVGWVVLVVGAVLTLVRLAELAFGIWALVKGRGLVRAYPPTPADEVLRAIQAAWSNTPVGESRA